MVALASFPDGRFLSGGGDGAVKMWKISDRKMPGMAHDWVLDFDFPESQGCSVRSLLVCGGKQVLAGGADGTIRVWCELVPEAPTMTID